MVECGYGQPPGEMGSPDFKNHLLVISRDLHLLEGPLDANVWDIREEIAAGHYTG